MKRCLFVLAFLLSGSFASAQPKDQIVGAQFIGAGGDFPITTSITRAVVGTDGLDVQFTKRDGVGRWPDTPNLESSGGMGPLEYSVGLALKVNGQWLASAPIEFWNGRPASGTGQIQDQTVTCATGTGQIHCNWFYDAGRWPGLFDARPAVGDTIGLFVVAGDVRNNVFVVRERSAIVTFELPPTGVPATFDFQNADAPAPPNDGTAPPNSGTTPPASDDGALDAVLAHLADLESRLAVIEEDVAQQAAKLQELETSQNQTQAADWAAISELQTRPQVATCSASILGIPIHCAVK